MSASATRASPRRTRYDGFRATLKLIGTGPRGSRDLTFQEARIALTALLSAEVTPAQAGAFLLAARIKGESHEELAGYTQALRDASQPLHTNSRRPLVACAGAYDGVAETPHLSLAAGVLAAACGAGIVMHCAPGVGPKHGVSSLDVLAALGGPHAPTLAESAAMLERSGATLVDSSQAVMGWDALLEVRNELGLRGPVHSAEKLLDYFGARRFVVGYTHSAYAQRLLGALSVLRAERAIAVRGIEGSDVVRPGRPVAAELDRPLEFTERLGLIVDGPGGVEHSARATEEILAGTTHGAERDAVLLAASVRIYAAGLVADARDGLDLAAAAIADGGASRVLAAMTGA